MLVNDKDALTRINSPLNLLNRIKERTGSASKAMSLFVPKSDSQKHINERSSAVPIFNPFHKSDPSSLSEKPASNLIKSESAPTDAQTAEDVKLETLLDGAESRIKLAHAHNNALELLNSAVDQLKIQLNDVKPDKLPSVIASAAKVVDGIRKERNEAAKNSGNRAVHLHFYTPQQKAVNDYEVIDVG